MFLGNAGTAMRPMTGVLCAGKGEFVLDGVPRMRERPIIDLVDGLKQLGVDITCSETGCPPVVIRANGIKGGEASISGQISSQFLSALLMASPLATGDIQLKIKDELMSAPYVQMTINLMKKYGAIVDGKDNKVFQIQPSKYVSPNEIFIEGDASSASYFLAGAAITGSRNILFDTSLHFNNNLMTYCRWRSDGSWLWIGKCSRRLQICRCFKENGSRSFV